MKILIADDDEVSRIKLRGLLTGCGYEVISAADGTEAWRLLQRLDAPHLAILDWMMPGMDGVEICRKVREERRSLYVYIILLTSRTEKQDVIAGLDAGADDYISKPFDAQELQVRVRTGKRIIELQKALRVQATRDALTGAWNRGAVMDIFERELQRGGRAHSGVGAVIIDIDHFKQINDSHGHAAGDAVLQQVVRRLFGALRPYDLLGRIGGDEFLVVAPDCGADDLLKLAERLRQAVTEDPVQTPDGVVSVTLSLGAATTLGCETMDAAALLQLADRALYRAKRGGRNRVELETITGAAVP